MDVNKSFDVYLKELSKNQLIDLICDYNKLACIFDDETISYNNKEKKDKLINKILDIKNKYIKYIIESLDLEDYNILKRLILKKVKNDFFNINRSFINYLVDKKILFQKDNLEIPSDIYMLLKSFLKNKNVYSYIKIWNRIYKLVDGIIIAYGLVDRNYFDIIISGIVDKEKIVPKIDFYYKKEYIIDDKKIMSSKLSSKKRIDSYYKNNKYKMYSNKEYVAMGNNSYHYSIKSYKKLIKMLKSNYVFKNDDIKFVNNNIVIPYLYNSLNEEDIAKKNLEETITTLFEFKGEKLKHKMLEEIMKIRCEFPLWEYRGFTKIEVNNE